MDTLLTGFNYEKRDYKNSWRLQPRCQTLNGLQFYLDTECIRKANTPRQLYEAIASIMESGNSSRVAALDGHSQKDDNFPTYLLSVQDAAIKIRATNQSCGLFLPSVPTSKDVVDYQNWCIDSQKMIADALDGGKAQDGEGGQAGARKRLVKRFPPGKSSKAWKELRRIVRAAARHVWIEDAWLSSDVVALLGEDLPDGVQLRVLGPEDGNRFWNGALASLKKMCKDLPGRIQVRVTTDVHDRYVYVDNHVWRFSESPKDMGAKRTAKIIDEGERSAELITDFKKRWSSARQVYPP
jgi:hypothetical protein